MKKFQFLTNIPTPYRTVFYNDLHVNGLDFEVLYMRSIEADRNWKIDLTQLKHPYIIDKGFYRMIGRFHVHFNPKLILRIIQAKNTDVIVGGAWNDIDVLLLVILKRIGIVRSRFHFWSEANYLTVGASNDNFLKKWLRKFVYHSSKGAQLLSGRMTEITLQKWGIKCYGFIPLPNTIDEDIFFVSDSNIAQRENNVLPVFLMPVRLVEQDKGIVNFFTAIGNENIRRARFIVAGDGADKNLVEQFIKTNALADHIILAGHCDTKVMVDLYRQANVFLLPSFSDPSPLSLIEAIKMQLPVLVSERCGNHFEAVIQGRNGEIFDPFTHEGVKDAFERLMNARPAWKQMGASGINLYEKYFQKQMVIQHFINALQNYTPKQPA